MKNILIAAIFAASFASPALAASKDKCQGTGTNYDKGNCERNNANEPVGNKH